LEACIVTDDTNEDADCERSDLFGQAFREVVGNIFLINHRDEGYRGAADVGKDLGDVREGDCRIAGKRVDLVVVASSVSTTACASARSSRDAGAALPSPAGTRRPFS
jgi:hypothetical protein